MADKIGIQAGASNAQAYEWTRSNYGLAALNVHERALSTLRAQEQRVPSLYLDVNPGTYRYGDTIVMFPGGISPVFSPPATGTRLDVLYLDCSSGTLAIEEGTAATAITDDLALPEVPAEAIPLVAVHLAAEQASITEADLYDMRPFLTVAAQRWVFGEWSSTSWDGDAKGTANNGVIDLSTVFGLPAGILAVSVSLTMIDNNLAAWCLIAQDDANGPYGVICSTQVANREINNHGIVQCDANGDVYFKTNTDLTSVKLYINAYCVGG